MLRKLIGVSLFYGRFLLSFSKLGFSYRKRNWTPLPQACFEDQTWLVTGASGGLGLASAQHAYGHGATVIATARNQHKLRQTAPDNPDDRWQSWTKDLSLREEIDELVRQLIREKRTVDVLVNNVGVMLHEFSETADGVETMFATNLLLHYYLTERLISADVLHPKSVVINVTSGGLYMAPLRVESLNAQSADEHNGTQQYALQKRAQLVLTNHWQSKYKKGPLFYAMHPGWADTQGVQQSLPTFRKNLRPLLRSPDQAADTIQWLAAEQPKPLKKLWFDRAPRPLHAYKFTRTTGAGEARVADYLEGFLPSLD